MALEYAAAFGFPLWIDRCGVIAGPGQFGRIDQGVFSYWIYQWQRGKPLAYIGFGGEGRQVRDFIAPKDLNRLLEMQLRNPDRAAPRIVNVGGGPDRSMSLWELSSFCQQTMGPAPLLTAVPETRPYDIPYFVTDSAVAERAWDWRPEEQRDRTLESIVRWARDHRDLLDLFAG
jgi:CDP-paratose 2-epimerase